MCYGDKNVGAVSAVCRSNQRITYTTITVFLAIRVDQMGHTTELPYTPIATISFTNDMATRCSRLEPCALKGCAVSCTERIANQVGWSSGQMTPRRTTNLDPKGKGDKSMSVKRGTTEGVYVVALQRLSDMVKAILPEPQCPAAETHALR
jgi:hypothetical protein